MYEYISGKITEITPTYVVIESAGVGYFINISLQTYSAFGQKAEAKAFVHQVVREDAHLLFGFSSKSERELFRMLISVSGVGANTARIILSSLTAADLEQAIARSDVDALKQIKGIGLKTAQRILVDLKGKLIKGDDLGSHIFSQRNNTIRDEALSALVMLGYPKGAAEKVIDQLLRKGDVHTSESLVKTALKGL
jgi:Holliday junction DNA helicase RuvA